MEEEVKKRTRRVLQAGAGSQTVDITYVLILFTVF